MPSNELMQFIKEWIDKTDEDEIREKIKELPLEEDIKVLVELIYNQRSDSK